MAETLHFDRDGKEVFRALLKTGLEAEDAYTVIQGIRGMAADNLVAQLLAEMRAMRWMLGLLIALVIALLGLFVAQAFRDRPAAPAVGQVSTAAPPVAAVPPVAAAPEAVPDTSP